ncbi:MAG: GNAT family N-acetyltransferase [Candidatus Berkiella sp.]
MLIQFMQRARTLRGPIARTLLSQTGHTAFHGVTPSFNHQRTTTVLRNFQTQARNPNYMRLPDFEHCVPSENYIDDRLADFLAGTRFASSVQFERYQGQQLTQPEVTPENQHRDQHYHQVHRFHMFKHNPILPNMEQGFVLNIVPDRVSRCHMAVDNDTGEVLGAIYFTINLELRVAFFQLVQVDSKLKQEGLGKLLMHSAIYVCLMYHCSSISLISMKRVIGFYENMGFVKSQENPNRDRYELDLLNGTTEQHELFLRSFNSTAPHIGIQNLIAELRQLHPNPDLVPAPQAIFDFVERKQEVNPLLSRCKPSP